MQENKARILNLIVSLNKQVSNPPITNKAIPVKNISISFVIYISVSTTNFIFA